MKYTKAYSGGVPKLIEGDVFKTKVPLNRIETTLTTPVTTLTTLTDTQQKIMELIRKNNRITRNELAEKVGITKDGVQYNLNILKEKRYLKRVGNTNNGYWEILEVKNG